MRSASVSLETTCTAHRKKGKSSPYMPSRIFLLLSVASGKVENEFSGDISCVSAAQAHFYSLVTFALKRNTGTKRARSSFGEHIDQIVVGAFQLPWRPWQRSPLRNRSKMANVPEVFFSERWEMRLLARRQQSGGQPPEVLTDVGVAAATLWRLSCLTPAASEETSSPGRRHVVVCNSALELSKYALVTVNTPNIFLPVVPKRQKSGKCFKS